MWAFTVAACFVPAHVWFMVRLSCVGAVLACVPGFLRWALTVVWCALPHACGVSAEWCGVGLYDIR